MGLLKTAGQGLGAFGSLYSGFSTAESYKAKASALDLQAGQTVEQGLWDQERLNEEARRTLATQRMIFGAAGVTLEGAPENLQRTTSEQYVLERMNRARNTRLAAEALRNEAREMRRAASSAVTAGVIGAFSSFF